MIPKETRKQIFPGILESGSVNGDLIGLGLEGTPYVVITSDKLWRRKDWTTDDVMELIETQSKLEGIAISRDGTMNSASILSFMVMHHLESSPLWSLEKKESYFESVQFQRVLELAKEYGEAPAPAEEVSTLIRDGRCVATFRDVYTPDNYVSILEEYGEESHFTGFPGQTNYAGYWNSVYLIVVNKQTKHMETIAAFPQYLLAIENQQKLVGTTSV